MEWTFSSIAVSLWLLWLTYRLGAQNSELLALHQRLRTVEEHLCIAPDQRQLLDRMLARTDARVAERATVAAAAPQ